MEEDKICCFFGHRNIEFSEELYAKTSTEILKAIDLGCRIFYFGGFGDFDNLCYQIVTKIKNENPLLQIQRVYCVTQERYLRKNSPHFQRENYEQIIYLQPAFDCWYKSIYFRNCAMIDCSFLCIFFAEERKNSGAYKTYLYAKKQKKFIVNLF